MRACTCRCALSIPIQHQNGARYKVLGAPSSVGVQSCAGAECKVSAHFMCFMHSKFQGGGGGAHAPPPLNFGTRRFPPLEMNTGKLLSIILEMPLHLIT